MGKRIIEVPLDGEQMVFVEVDDKDMVQGTGGALAPIASPQQMFERAGGSVRSALDTVIMPTVHTLFDGLRKASPDAVEVEFGLKLIGKAGAVFASTEAEGHITVKMTWNLGSAPPSAAPATDASSGS